MAIFLGIDAGGTKTTCVAGDEKSLLATATTGGSNVVRCGEAEARKELQAAIEKACVSAGVKLSDVARICVGIAGAARPAISSIVWAAISEKYGGAIEVVGDMVIAMEAAFGTEPGVIVIAGTGSIAYGRNAEGRTARAGGWGFAISDEGSGHWIGRKAISAVLQARDEDEAAARNLAEAILRTWQLKDLDELIRIANSTAADFPALCPVVFEAADSGDHIARAILQRAGEELARLAKIVIHRLYRDSDGVPVAMSGGVFRNSGLVRNAFHSSLRSEYPGVVIRPDVVDPVQGALQLARAGMRST